MRGRVRVGGLVLCTVVALGGAVAWAAAPAGAGGFEVEQPTMEVTVTGAERQALDRLVARAMQVSPAILEATTVLDQARWSVSLEGRLSNALIISGGAGVANDAYGQAVPSYSIRVSLDAIKLVAPAPATGALEARLSQARAQTRLAVTEAFTRYLVAVAGAESAAQGLESAESAFRVTTVRYRAGDVIAADVIDARSKVSEAAVSLLRANAEVVVALEGLAAVTGLPAEELTGMVAGGP